MWCSGLHSWELGDVRMMPGKDSVSPLKIESQGWEYPVSLLVHVTVLLTLGYGSHTVVAVAAAREACPALRH